MVALKLYSACTPAHGPRRSRNAVVALKLGKRRDLCALLPEKQERRGGIETSKTCASTFTLPSGSRNAVVALKTAPGSWP